MLRRFNCSLIAAALCITLCSCKEREKKVVQVSIPPETISVIYPPEISSVMKQAFETFYHHEEKLPNGAGLRFESMEEPSIRAAHEISRGEIKSVMWIAPLPGLVEYVNSHLVNLGARQVECKKIFSTSLVAATNQAVTKKIFTSTPVRADFLAADPPHAVAMPRADRTDAGLLAMLYVLRQQRDQASPTPEQISGIRTFGSTEHMLSVLPVNYFGKPRSALTTEQAVIRHNKSKGDSNHTIEASYFSDDPPQLEYMACISDADWLSAAQRAGGLLLQKHLLSQDTQIAAQREGFRSVQYETDKLGSFTAQMGVREAAPPASQESAPAGLVETALNNTAAITPQRATMYVVDASASMQGLPLATIKRLIRTLIEKDAPQNYNGVISFNANVELVSPPVLQRTPLYPYIAGLETDGGSAVYDAILLAAEQLGKEEFGTLQRRIVVLTDGNDQSSRTVLSFFGSAFERRSAGREIAMNIFQLKREGIDGGDLRQIAEILGGSLHEYSAMLTPEEMTRLIDEN